MKTTLLLMVLVISSVSYGQSTLRPNMYYQDMNYYNIAALPLKDSLKYSYSIYAKHKFVENENYIWNKPTTFFLNHIGAIKNKPAFYNVAYISDRYSFYSRNTIYTGYLHKFKFGKNKNSTLSVGGRLVLNFDVIDWDKFTLPSGESGKSLKPNADLDLGALYRFKRFTLGFSSKNVIGTSVKLDGEKLLINQREYYINASYLFRIKNNYEIAPYILVRKELNTEFDIGLHLSLFKRVDLSYQLRLLKLCHIFSIQGHITRSLSVGAAFDYSPLLPDNNLDIFVRYTF